MPVLRGKPACLPDGVRLFAVGDIHGRLDLLQSMVDQIEADDRSSPSARSILVFVGDYIDRGPDSAGVIDFLVEKLPERFESVLLRGNHEDMMLRSFEDPHMFDVWALNGGDTTAESYGVSLDAHGYAPGEIPKIVSRLRAALPASHLAFLEGLQLTYEIGDYFFVHAGVRPGVPLNRQDEQDCLYIRDRFLRFEGDFGRVIVHGHTPVHAPELRPNRIGIDTGAVFGGRLTAVRLEGRTQRFLSCE